MTIENTKRDKANPNNCIERGLALTFHQDTNFILSNPKTAVFFVYICQDTPTFRTRYIKVSLLYCWGALRSATIDIRTSECEPKKASINTSVSEKDDGELFDYNSDERACQAGLFFIAKGIHPSLHASVT